MIVGRQKGTESKARIPDNVTLAKNLQPPHLEDEDNSICLRNILLRQPNDTKQSQLYQVLSEGTEHVFRELYHLPDSTVVPLPSSTAGPHYTQFPRIPFSPAIPSPAWKKSDEESRNSEPSFCCLQKQLGVITHLEGPQVITGSAAFYQLSRL